MMDVPMIIEVMKQTKLLFRFGIRGVVIGAVCLITGAMFLGFGVDADLPWPVTTNTTIAPKHCQGTILAGTGSTGQFTLTLPAATEFPSNCSVLIKNGDSTNGKTLSGFPPDLYTILWPKQSVGVKIINGAWQTFYNPGPWVAPAGGLQLYANASGNDSNDGLTFGTPITLKGACSFRSRFATFYSGSIAINLADGTYSTVDGNNALCTVLGNAGGSATALTGIFGNCTSPTNVILKIPNDGIGLNILDGGEAAINCVQFTGGNNANGIQCGQHTIADYNQIVWGTFGTNAIHLSATRLCSVNVGAKGEILTADFSVHWSIASGSTLTAGGTTSIPSAISFTDGNFLIALGNVHIDLSALTISGAGVAGTTGGRASLTGPGYMVTAGATECNSFFPGDRSCVFSLGFKDNANDAEVGYFIGSNLPACNTNTRGLRTHVLNGVSSPTYMAAVGSTTGSSDDPVYCNGSVWVYN
jgi:hypothetical protein